MDPASAVMSVVPHYPHDPWVHLLARASIYLSHVIKSCQGPGWLRSWGTESWDMGHPVSYDHHTLGPNMRPSHWLMMPDLASDWSLARLAPERHGADTNTRNHKKYNKHCEQSTVAPGNDTGLWWQCGDRHHGAPGPPVPVAREELLKLARTAITFPDGLLVWEVSTECTLLMGGEQIPRYILLRHVTVYRN